MSNLQMREFLAAAGLAAAAGALTRPKRAEAGDLSFMNNGPDPVASGDELPTFKFAPEASEGKVIGDSSGKEATVEQLPISKGIAGVSMRPEPGAMRELHWHATAAEWAFVIEGRVRTTVIEPQDAAETNDSDPGDVWYFPRGHGHMLRCPRVSPIHFVTFPRPSLSSTGQPPMAPGGWRSRFLMPNSASITGGAGRGRR